jgi:hypothetical protein
MGKRKRAVRGNFGDGRCLAENLEKSWIEDLEKGRFRASRVESRVKRGFTESPIGAQDCKGLRIDKLNRLESLFAKIKEDPYHRLWG